MSITFHANFWFPRTSLAAVVSKTLEALPSLGFGLPEAKATGTMEEFQKVLKSDSSRPDPTWNLGPLLHVPTEAEVYFELREFRTQQGSVVRVHVSADEFHFRRNFTILTPVNSARIQFDAALIGFYERTGAHFGHFGSGDLGAWTYIKGLDPHESYAIEASKVLRDEIPLLDHINLVPKAMHSKFLPDDRLDRHDPRLRVAELHDEGLLIGFSDCMTNGGSGAGWWQFAADFKLGLDTP